MDLYHILCLIGEDVRNESEGKQIPFVNSSVYFRVALFGDTEDVHVVTTLGVPNVLSEDTSGIAAGVDMAKDNATDIIEITSLPKENPIIGDEFGEEVGIGTVKPGYAFQVLCVEGHVKWKEHGPGEPDAD